MRCDLHVHSTASGRCSTPGLKDISLESYNDPSRVYDRLKQLGMSVVTITDHDSIDAVEDLRKHLDFFVSEEATVTMPSGTEMHLGVYNIAERDHVEIQRRRADFVSLLMYLTERKLFFSVNHVFSGLTGRREAEDFNWFASYIPAYETRNGQMWPEAANHDPKFMASMIRCGELLICVRGPWHYRWIAPSVRLDQLGKRAKSRASAPPACQAQSVSEAQRADSRTSNEKSE